MSQNDTLEDKMQQLSVDSKTKPTYFYCTRCCQTASNQCIRHRQQILVFDENEIPEIPVHQRFQCQVCSRATVITSMRQNVGICEQCMKYYPNVE